MKAKVILLSICFLTKKIIGSGFNKIPDWLKLVMCVIK